jgi:outer membrane protein assembly factor BamD
MSRPDKEGIYKMTPSYRRVTVLFLILLFFISGCASVPVKKQPGPGEYYNNAMDELNHGGIFGPDYELIRGSLNQIIDNYPYSTYAPLAQLRIADTYYKESRYLESAEAYNHFVKMYPNDKQIPYAVFMEGKSFLNNQKTWLTGSIPDDIDQTGIHNALDEFKYIMDSYPASEYVAEAKKYAQKCEYTLAMHDMYIADFYIDHEHYEAAINRLQEIYSKYPQSGLADRALYKLAGVYKKINSPEEYKQTMELLKQAYPDSSFIK